MCDRKALCAGTPADEFVARAPHKVPRLDSRDSVVLLPVAEGRPNLGSVTSAVNRSMKAE
jgi:hypothetical protein